MWNDEPFTRGQAWIDLIGLCQWKESKRIIKGIAVIVPRGAAPVSLRYLAQRWQWSKGKVDRYIKALQEMDMIGTHKKGVTTLISLTNYESYQSGVGQQRDAKRTQTGQRRDADGTETGRRRDKEKEGKKVKKERKGIRERMSDFKISVFEHSSKYDSSLLEEFFDYWAEHGKGDKLMRFEEKDKFSIPHRLSTWFKQDKKFNPEKYRARPVLVKKEITIDDLVCESQSTLESYWASGHITREQMDQALKQKKAC